MIIRKLVVACLAVAGVTLACATITPPEGPGTQFPCGRWGVECPNGRCCEYKHVCGDTAYGYFNRCTPGYCCYEGGDDWPGALPDGGAHRMTKQFDRSN